MQEVFEKIVEKLNKERFCYFLTIANTGDKSLDVAYEKVGEAIDKAIEIVKQEAAEYNSGWIPCSERLPEEHKQYDITFKNSTGIHSDSAIYNPYLKRWLWDADETELVENEILAWAEKREPYQPKGE